MLYKEHDWYITSFHTENADEASPSSSNRSAPTGMSPISFAAIESRPNIFQTANTEKHSALDAI